MKNRHSVFFDFGKTKGRRQHSLVSIALSTVIFLSGCANSNVKRGVGDLGPEDIPQPVPRKDIFVNYGEHPFCSNIKFASDDYNHYKGVFGNTEYYENAKESFVYAWMASNTYEDFNGKKPEFELTEWEKIGGKITTWRGMGAHIYLSRDKKKIVVAYEGTNFSSWRDWAFGNFNVFWKGQYSEALKLAKNVASKYPDAQLITTGHSLGGGLAIHVALRINGVTAYAFNSSPRVFAPRTLDNPDSRLVLASENIEILNEIRKKWRTLDNYQQFNEYDFLNSDKITEHSIYYIGRGLVNVAASTGEKEYVDIAKRVITDSSGILRSPEICPV